MKIIIKKDGEVLKERDVPFSIGDIVTVVSYGNRYASQDKAYKCSTLCTKPPLNKWEYDLYNYEKCNEEFGDLQWKIIDVGVFCGETVFTDFIIRLINRDKKELLIKHSVTSTYDRMKIVRKGKKQYKEYIINLNK